jgi:hypothetical protein
MAIIGYVIIVDWQHLWTEKMPTLSQNATLDFVKIVMNKCMKQMSLFRWYGNITYKTITFKIDLEHQDILIKH